jgi:gliding motility-associated-like protein
VYVRVELDTHNPLEEKCHQVVTLELILNPLPPVADMDVYPICEHNTGGAANFNIQQFVNNQLGNTGNYDIDYFTDAALTTPAIPVNAYPVTGGSDTVYVRIVNTDTGCTIIKELQLVVEEYATATQPADSVLEECDTDGSNDGFFVFDLTQVAAEVLGIQDPNDFTVTYHTSFEDADSGANPIANPAAFANTQIDTQPVWIRVVSNSSVGECDAIVRIDVVVERLPVPLIAGGTICVDKSTEGILRPLVIDTQLTTGIFEWTLTQDGTTTILPEQGPVLIAEEAGEYNVTVTSLSGCVSDPIPPVTVIKSGPAVKIGRGYYVTNYFSDNQNITVTVDGYGIYEYKLDEGPWQTDNVFTNVSPGTHTVTVRDTNPDGCGETILTGANIVDYMNFFTPNDDGIRDYWNVIGLDQPDAKIYIFDRYGKLLKQISAVGEGWDGTYNGAKLPATDYWFTVTYREFDGTTTIIKEFKAHFSLLR